MSASFRSSVSTRGLAIARICGLRADCWCSSCQRCCATARTWLAAMCGNPGKLAHGWQPCAGYYRQYPLFYCTRTPRIRVRESELQYYSCTPVPGLGSATPGRVILRPYTPSTAGTKFSTIEAMLINLVLPQYLPWYSRRYSCVTAVLY